MSTFNSDPFHGVLIWHRFDPSMSDADLEAALAAADVNVVMIDRDAGVVFVDKDNTYTQQIQQVLGQWVHDGPAPTSLDTVESSGVW